MINRPRSRVFPFFFALTLLVISHHYGQNQNVILFLTDDQGFGDLGIHGNADILTPNIDAFSGTAVEFHNFLVAPVCSPTRASLMTGRYNFRTQVVDTWLGRSLMQPGELTLPEILKSHGYKTGIFGKWHLGDNYPRRPQDQGFDEALVILGGGIGQKSDPINGSTYYDPVLQHNGVETKYQGYCMNVFTDNALRFMDQNRSSPFFVYLAGNTPHDPWTENPPDAYNYYLSQGYSNTLAIYYSMITNIDNNFKRVLDKVDSLGLRNNTLVIYMSDNGQASAGKAHFTAGLKGGKTEVYENGIRAPFFIRWPGGFSGGRRINLPAAHIDLLPTLLDALNIPLPGAVVLDGISLMPLLTTTNPVWPDRNFFFQAHRGDVPKLYQNSAVRTQRWKLIPNRSYNEVSGAITPQYELYDLQTDSGESNNVAAANPLIVNNMAAAYRAWFTDVTTAPGFTPQRIEIGTPYENPTTLTREDWRGAPTWNDTSVGYWRLNVMNPGTYRITLQFPSSLSIAAPVYVTGQGLNLSGTLPANATEFVFNNVALTAGTFDLRGWKENSGQWGALRAIVQNMGITGISKNGKNPEIQIYGSRIHIQIPAQTRVSIRIYNLRGQNVWTYSENLEQGKYSIPLGLSDLPIGVYSCKFNFGTDHGTRKIVLEGR